MKESKTLDLKDRKILFELDSNARASCSSIAKKVGLSTEVVNYRIKRLEKEEIITGYTAMVNLATLGVVHYKVCLTVQHISSVELEKIMSELKKIPEVKWIVQTMGNWDVVITVEAKSMEDADRVKREVLSKFANSVSRKEISFLVEAHTFNRNYLIGRKRTEKSRVIMKKLPDIDLDALDISILKALARNSRMPLIELSSNLKTTSRVLHYRIKQLEKKRIISGYKISINYEKIGIKFFKTFMYLANPEKKRFDELLSYLTINEHVTHDVKVMGNWDIEPEFEVYSDKEFNNIMIEIKDKFSDIISRIDVITISKEHKFEYF
jgi:DNA-binding Lrp family transcriptional regulator